MAKPARNDLPVGLPFAALVKRDLLAGLNRRQEVSEIAFHVGKVHLIEDEEVRRLGVLRLNRVPNQLQRGLGDVIRRLQAVRIADDVLVARPVRTHRHQCILGIRVFAFGMVSCINPARVRGNPACECLGELGLSGAGKTRQNQEAF